ncbi:siderophore ABC transporter substrate-binding protein [Wenxinia saemankumensis]|uniref:Iron complex transport system substrate-binding protein n=1 Tax=Wenxinia saemankumensis TaxID=1447782 RepID=A0A1M6ACB8_9RHOB|nr:siderophore ABC transporter substrate-binding protein [Wenxinia saemankumensis]SHI34077.1 iron complex transport system substrate-binding protein [Wenxinia saemankumensis]
MILRTSLLAATLLPGAALAQATTIETATGPVELDGVPGTVVALDLAAIDTLSALGVTVAGVPDITPPAYLADTLAQAEIVGTLFEPDFETIAAMGPDLIVAGGRSQSQVEPLSQIAPTLDMTIGEDVVQQGLARLEAYGALFGHEAEAEALREEFAAVQADVQDAAADEGEVLILLANGGTLSAYGAGSRFGWIHTDLGLAEAVPDLDAETHGEAVSFEFVAETDPDWIFVVDRGAAIGQEGEAAAATLDNPLIAGTTAAQEGQIVYLDPAPLYLAGGGIRSLIATTTEIAEALGADASGS